MREQHNSNAEVDIVYVYKNKTYPIEIKSGTKGRLRSLMLFIDESPLNIGIRLCSNTYSKEAVETLTKKPFQLLNIPYYHVTKIDEYLKLV